MAASIFVKQRNTLSDNVMVLADVTMDSAYLTGGELVTPANFGLSRIDHLICEAPPVGGVVATYVPSTGGIKMWNSSTGAPALLVETASGEDLSLAVVPVVVFGA